MTTPAPCSTGRRKTATATAWLSPGKGQTTVNGRPLDEYFTTDAMRTAALRPLHATELAKKYDVVVRASGGGLAGQAGAVRLAIARALLVINADLRPALKKEKLLTRDPRMKERKKSGQPGARKRFQFSKR